MATGTPATAATFQVAGGGKGENPAIPAFFKEPLRTPSPKLLFINH